MGKILYFIKKLFPVRLYRTLISPYHYIISVLGPFVYGFPSNKLIVIGVTGTKGKSSTVELINAILEEAGYTTALSSTIRFKIADESERNLYKMTMPGRFFMQRFLRDAVRADCNYAVLEMTSEGVTQHRQRGIALDMLVFTNITPEHIESHGSFENYLGAKLKLRDLLGRSRKKQKWIVANTDDEHGSDFLDVPSAQPLPFSLSEAEPYTSTKRGLLITVDGASIHSPLLGSFNIYNLLAAIAVAKSQNIPPEIIKKALENYEQIAGRAEHIEVGQPFSVIVDYAHTPDSLLKLYTSFKESHEGGRRICVLGNAGGGRDTWKRPVMGGIADEHCNIIVLTDEDPYDEDPRKIVEEMASGIKTHKPKIIMDRREAVQFALKSAQKNDVVLITGKGTDPYIMGKHGSQTVWSDKKVVTEELQKLLKKDTL